MSQIAAPGITLITPPDGLERVLGTLLSGSVAACRYRPFEPGTTLAAPLDRVALFLALGTGQAVVLQAASGHLTVLHPAHRADEARALFLEDPALWRTALAVAVQQCAADLHVNAAD